jgi:hypothetical protein
VFADAAKDWKGWVGAKTWKSIEGELRLELTTDRLGQSCLRSASGQTHAGADLWELTAAAAGGFGVILLVSIKRRG